MKSLMLFGALVVICITTTGCGKYSANDVQSDTEKVSTESKSDGWWCNEHGVPEEICAQCSEKLAKEYKAKGDWCQKHDRPESQCFLCHPELEAKFAAVYEAKYGKKPPKPSAD
ncbi:MAG TPA: RND transporter [Pirellulales bacterium]|nr:RND transporter [Pirellulales bacterium]